MKMDNEQLIKKVNEVYHNIISGGYDDAHPAILNEEKVRWKKSVKYLKSKKPLKILDIGTGTGFVPLTVAKYLKPSDEFTCLDVSSEMLKLTKEKVKLNKFKCKFKFIRKFVSELKSDSMNIITIDSVLHHIQDTKEFLYHINRILEKEGILIIGHEPNNRFRKNKILSKKTHYYNILYNPKTTIWKMSKKVYFNKILEGIFFVISKTYRKKIKRERLIAEEINKILFKESVIKHPLSLREIEEIVEIKAESGFDPFEILPEYKRLYFETYNHLSEDLAYKGLVKKQQDYLKKRFPNDGATFFMVLQK